MVLAASVVALGAGATPSGDDRDATRPAALPSAAASSPPVLDMGTAPVPSRGGKTVALGEGEVPVRRLRTGTRAGVAFDLRSGRVLWRKDAARVLPVASLTKMMTALLVVESAGPGERVRIPRAAEEVSGSRMGYLRAGRTVRVEALLHGLMMSSGNDAAIALAHHVGGSEREFVREMNRRARDLGLACTRFVNPHGLGAGNRSCAADLGEIAVRAMAEPRIAAVARKRSTRVRIGSYGRRWLATTNPLVRAKYPGALGLKTGYTARAGRCLVAVVRQDGRQRVVVLLHSSDPGRAARRVLAATRGS